MFHKVLPRTTLDKDFLFKFYYTGCGLIRCPGVFFVFNCDENLEIPPRLIYLVELNIVYSCFCYLLLFLFVRGKKSDYFSSNLLYRDLNNRTVGVFETEVFTGLGRVATTSGRDLLYSEDLFTDNRVTTVQTSAVPFQSILTPFQ